ncbi:peptidase A24A, prepilin type IV [Proteiniborus sp. DW1]|uniref:A24 family peptidase n=1 Tax=Proteiniborus sp. DW1 TaxID=1889883 RepID=UPI00092E185F|nr:A24 family peptidase [Proteiniborus sp. DW1]SCG83652.1 peptidase A24A, prepilin type IV [Proteiniborus sp. DW1]
MENVFLIIFILTLIVIGIVDFRIYIIPNKLIFPMLFVGVIYQVLFGNIKEMLLGFIVSFSIGFIAWSLGGMGGGDVKLMATIGLWLGFESFVVITIIASCFGLIWAAVDFIRQKRLKEKAKHILGQLNMLKYVGFKALDVKNKDMKKPIPYGACLALSTLISLFIF